MLMDSGDSDVEIEEEWEEVLLPQLPAVPAAGRGDITIYLNADDGKANQDAGEGKKKRPAGRVYTKRERDDALMVHRVHCLCMLAHALVHDTAAADKELQALLVSLLPFDLLEIASAAASSEDPMARAWLPKLLHWFHNTFSLTAAPTQPQHHHQQQHLTGPSSSNGAGGSSRRQARGWGVLEDLGLGFAIGSVQEQLLACVSARSGSSTQLATLLVALLRAVGFLTRSVWSLDPLPFKPAAVHALQQGKSIRATTVTPAAAAAGHQGPAAAGSKRGRAKAADNTTAAAAAGYGYGDGGAGEVAGGRGRGSKRGRGGRGSKAAAGSKGSRQAPAAAAAAGDGDGDAPGSAPKRRRGDEEFERELAMALEATAAAEAASKKGSSGSRSGPAATSNGLCRAESRSLTAAAAAAAAAAAGGAGGSGAGRKQQSFAGLIAKGASAEQLKRAAAASAAAVPAGWLWLPRQGALAAPKVWGEVYVGGSADGRWLHVDGLLGCYDQPTAVEAAVVRRQPLSYVVACQEGAPKDVTRRYAVNFLVNLKWRDEAWWSETMAALRSTAAHLHPHLAAQVAAAAPTADTADAALAAAIVASLSDAAATAMAHVKGPPRKRRQQQQQLEDADAEQQPQQQQQQAEEVELDAAAAAAAQPQRKRTKRQQQQQQQPKQQPDQQQQQPARKSATPKGPGYADDNDSDGVTITEDRPAPAPPPPAAAAANSAAAAAAAGRAGSAAVSGDGVHDGGSPTAAALRAAREDAELSSRAAQQAAGPPTTVDGFKAHPLYVLQRHITKYQAVCPGAVKLGLHKGEAYFSRADVQELHTAERWEREGRQVRADELDKPAKVVKKRALPAGGVGSGRSFGGSSRGGWGPWQRSNSSSSMKAGSAAAAAADPEEDPAAAAAGASAAAAAAAGDQAGDKEGSGAVDSNMQQLYGLWQTDAFVRRAVDGKVPRNQRGNVEVPPLAKSLPEGTAYIDAPNVAPICRSLGIDYAPALVGFEVQGGRMVPRIRGVVVCEEHEQAVIEQHIKREAELAAAEQEKRARTAAAAWRRLLNRMWTKIELQHKYGTTGATDAAAAGGGVAAAGAAAALGPSGDGRHLKEVIGSLNAAAGGSSFLQQQDSAVPTAAAVATAAAAGAGDRQPGSSAAAADGTVPVTVDAAEASGSGVAGQLSAAAAGQQAARAGGGTAGVRRSNRPLPPGVAPTGQPLLADAAWQAAAAAGESAAAGQSVDGGQEQEQGAAQQLGLYALDGVEVEEF